MNTEQTTNTGCRPLIDRLQRYFTTLEQIRVIGTVESLNGQVVADDPDLKATLCSWKWLVGSSNPVTFALPIDRAFVRQK